MSILDTIKNKAKGGFTTTILSRVVLALVLVIVGQFIYGMVLRSDVRTAEAERDKAELLAKVSKSVAHDNKEANRVLAAQLNECATENVRVKEDGTKAIAQKDEQLLVIAKQRDSWHKRYDKARSVKLCDELLNKSIAQVCPNIKDF